MPQTKKILSHSKKRTKRLGKLASAIPQARQPQLIKSLIAAAGLLLAQAPGSANAADIIFTEQVPNIPLYGVDVGFWTLPTFVDIDGDGDYDAFFGESYGAVKYFENTGTNTAPAFVERTGDDNPLNSVDVGKYNAPSFIDIDNDGDFDAFFGEMLGTVKYYENTGNNSEPAFVEQIDAANPLNGIDVGYSSTPTFVDIDGDGDYDAFIGEATGIANYYENTGTNGSPTFVEQTGADNPLNVVSVGKVSTFVDIDNDGDYDAFVGQFSGTVKYFENTGTNLGPIFVERTGIANPLDGIDMYWDSAPTFVDIDNDGDFDAFITGVYKLGPALKNNGTMAAPSFTIWDDSTVPMATVNVYEYSTPTFVDIDGDGDFDAFTGEYPYGSVKYYENTGTNTAPIFIERTGADNPLSSAYGDYIAAPTFVDIDGDGDFDVFIGEYYGAVYYYENTGTNTEPTFVERTDADNPLNGVDVEDSNAPTFVDIDNDGDFDAFIGEYHGNVNYFENTGTNSEPIFVERTDAANPLNGVDVGENSTPAFVDIDNDGDFDAFVGERAGNVNYFENTGTKSEPFFVEQTGDDNPLDGIDVGTYSTPTFVDIDGDGDFEAFIGEEIGVINSFRNDTSPPNIMPAIMLLLDD